MYPKNGIGIIASMAYDENQDSGLTLIKGDKIFEKNHLPGLGEKDSF